MHYPTNELNPLAVNKELQILNRIGKLLAEQSGFNPETLTDDAFWDPQTRLIYTTDMLVENRHFNMAYFTPYDLGWKTAAVNISDIAGMGGAFRHILLAMTLPDSIELDWIQAFYEGCLAVCQRFKGQIIGGDTVSSNTITISATAIGQCPVHNTVGHRYHAKEEDIIVSTGFHGLSAVGLKAFQQNLSGYEACKQTHLRPMPRIEAGLALSGRFRRYALMDSSDGLADALLKIAQASGVNCVVEASLIERHPEVLAYQTHLYSTRNEIPPTLALPHKGGGDLNSSKFEISMDESALRTILYGGEDFELVAAIPEWDPALSTYFKPIGHVEACINNPAGAFLEFQDTGVRQSLSLQDTYQHFQDADSHLKVKVPSPLRGNGVPEK